MTMLPSSSRFSPLSVVLCASLLSVACSSGESDEGPSTFGASFTTNDSVGDTVTDESTDSGTTSDTGTTTDTTTTDTTTTDTTTDTTDTTETDTGVEDPCPLICDGKPDSTPNTCDGPYIIGRTSAKNGFFFGGNTTSATDDDNEACGPNSDPSNWDTSHDHFFRLWLYTGDTIAVQQNANGWDPRLKVHDEADCIGKAKICSTNDSNMIEYTALKDDWFTIVADGQSIAFNDYGDYSITVDLTPGPNPDTCGCP